MTDTPLLSVEHLTKRFGGIAACDDVSFHLMAGERLALIGPNGAGKTTCFNLLSGLLKPDSGTISVNGCDITRQPAHRRISTGMARTFQIAMPYRQLRVIENVALALAGQQRRGSWRLFTSLPADQFEQAAGILDRIGLPHLADMRAENLAYGDQKRLEIAMVMAAKPRLLLLDEPMAGITNHERAALMAQARALSEAEQETSAAILFTEHDMDIVFDHATRIIVLDHGRIIADGKPEEIADNALVQNIYLGTETVYEEGGA